MHVESPCVNITTRMAFILSEAPVADGIDAVAATCDHECVKVTHCHRVHLFVMELVKLVDSL
jgi:hypothetical protein